MRKNMEMKSLLHTMEVSTTYNNGHPGVDRTSGFARANQIISQLHGRNMADETILEEAEGSSAS